MKIDVRNHAEASKKLRDMLDAGKREGITFVYPTPMTWDLASGVVIRDAAGKPIANAVYRPGYGGGAIEVNETMQGKGGFLPYANGTKNRGKRFSWFSLGA